MGESEIANEWRAEGYRQGSLKAMRTAVLRALEIRVKAPPPAEVVKTVELMNDLNELSRWHRAAVAATSLEEFLTSIRR
ncbi:MAG TPA: hypothetical protein VEL76_08415 [Gemmataceae bacterium]|nr:hypothetical protein [Gemmataceae bacterium]